MSAKLDENVLQWLHSRFHVHQGAIVFSGSGGNITPSILTMLGQLGSTIVSLDLSFSCPGDDLRYLENLFGLRVLTLDSCQLSDMLIVPTIGELRILSLNKNCLTDLDKLLKGLNIRLSQLEHLSLIGNPLCPHPSFKTRRTSRDPEEEYQREYVVWRLPNTLKFLDDRPVRLAKPPLTNQLQSETLVGDKASTGDVGHFIKSQFNAIMNLVTPQSFKISARSEFEPGQTHIKMQQLTKASLATTSPQHQANSNPTAEGKRAAPNQEALKLKEPRVYFGKLKFKYSGKNSEGNRYIQNEDL